jgi:hypothetical protein
MLFAKCNKLQLQYDSDCLRADYEEGDGVCGGGGRAGGGGGGATHWTELAYGWRHG